MLAAGGPADSLNVTPTPTPLRWPSIHWAVNADTLEAKERPYHSHFTLDFAQGGGGPGAGPGCG